jgi:hypothetical protein
MSTPCGERGWRLRVGSLPVVVVPTALLGAFVVYCLGLVAAFTAVTVCTEVYALLPLSRRCDGRTVCAELLWLWRTRKDRS